jgi:hypothetical protein
MSNICAETLPDKKGCSRHLPFFKTISPSRQPKEEIKALRYLPGKKLAIVGHERLHLRLGIEFHEIL